ncbi:MAG: phosphoglycolate phosphatase [Pseudorhodobacter sp.]|jgi:phosphoglycolate phosphatase
MIEAIVFDKDGTLFDFRQSWGGWSATLLQSLAISDAHFQDMAAAIGYFPSTQDFAPDSPVIAATAYEIAAALSPYLPEYSIPKLVNRLNEMAQVAVMKEAVPLAETLSALRQRGLKLAVATNDFEAPARAHLAAHDVLGQFDFVAGCDSGHGAKPAPGMLLAFVRQFGLTPSRVVMVGDSRHDLDAGRAAGMQTVAVLTGIAGTQELAPYADIVLPNIGGLAAWLDGQISA